MSNTWDGAFHESATSYYAAVGYLCHQWNNVEHFVHSLGAETLRLEFKTKSIVLRHIGVTSILTLIQEYSERHFAPEVHACLKHTSAYVDRCRINRNSIVHGFPETDSETGAEILRHMPDRQRAKPRTMPISTGAVRQVCMECEVAGTLLIRGQFLVAPPDKLLALRRSETWAVLEQGLYAKPALPESLVANPQKPPTPQPLG